MRLRSRDPRVVYQSNPPSRRSAPANIRHQPPPLPLSPPPPPPPPEHQQQIQPALQNQRQDQLLPQQLQQHLAQPIPQQPQHLAQPIPQDQQGQDQRYNNIWLSRYHKINKARTSGYNRWYTTTATTTSGSADTTRSTRPGPAVITAGIPQQLQQHLAQPIPQDQQGQDQRLPKQLQQHLAQPIPQQPQHLAQPIPVQDQQRQDQLSPQQQQQHLAQPTSHQPQQQLYPSQQQQHLAQLSPQQPQRQDLLPPPQYQQQELQYQYPYQPQLPHTQQLQHQPQPTQHFYQPSSSHSNWMHSNEQFLPPQQYQSYHQPQQYQSYHQPQQYQSYNQPQQYRPYQPPQPYNPNFNETWMCDVTVNMIVESLRGLRGPSIYTLSFYTVLGEMNDLHPLIGIQGLDFFDFFVLDGTTAVEIIALLCCSNHDVPPTLYETVWRSLHRVFYPRTTFPMLVLVVTRRPGSPEQEGVCSICNRLYSTESPPPPVKPMDSISNEKRRRKITVYSSNALPNRIGRKQIQSGLTVVQKNRSPKWHRCTAITPRPGTANGGLRATMPSIGIWRYAFLRIPWTNIWPTSYPKFIPCSGEILILQCYVIPIPGNRCKSVASIWLPPDLPGTAKSWTILSIKEASYNFLTSACAHCFHSGDIRRRWWRTGVFVITRMWCPNYS
ncbi:unnamed protein product [Trichogramma brassicae]|uniref:Uncharacterized protein n=1 Tax=Trichogramma brassicae TaxID=86971 RepID=A0A6H5IXH9_9HYME|nr:unnamed protein product [Trichogramma brassicae]